MKKLAYIAGLLAVMATACSPDKLNTMFADEGTGIRLAPVCTELNTKATIPGENKYKENTIDRFLYFIYSDAAGTNLVTSGESANGEPLFLVLDEFSALTTPKKGYVYVIANLPDGTELPETKTVANLKEIALSSSFYTGDAKEGVVNPDNRFVMATESAQEFTLVEHRAVEVPARLKRVAAKIQLKIDAAKHVTQSKTNPDGTTKPIKEWESVINKLQVYLLWAAKDGTLQGTPLTYSDDTKGSYYSTPRYAMFTGGTEDSTVPASAITETTKTYTEHIWQDGALVPVEKTIPIYQVESTPMYSYPISWAPTDAQAPFIKIILPWMGTAINEDGTRTPDSKPADEVPVEVTGNYYVVDWNQAETMGGEQTAGRYLKIGQTKFEMYGDRLEIPIKSSHDLTVDIIGTSYPFFTGNGGTKSLTSSEFSIVPDGLDKVVVTHELVKNINDFGNNGANAKDVAPITYKFKIRHTDDASYITEVITVIQYPAIYIDQLEGGNVFIDGFFQYLDHAPSSPFRNAISYTWHNTDAGYRSANFTGTQFTYTANLPNGNANLNAGNTNNGYNYLLTPYGGLGYDGKTPTKTTLITVSAFSEGSGSYTLTGDANSVYEYAISDPRRNNDWPNNYHLTPYLTSQSGSTGNNIALTSASWSSMESSIKVGSGNTQIRREGGKTYYSAPIAPAFLISSRWGRPGSGGNFPQNLRQAESRCATYQEAGYPAGRWRLPTEAEVYYVYILQQKGLVGDLFNTSGYGYWASSGRYFGGDSGSANFNTPTGNANHSVRCVYDYWYWTDKVDKYKFTPKP